MSETKPNNCCPVLTCRSHRIARHGVNSEIAKRIALIWKNRETCPMDQCKDCGAVWEPWPDNTPADDVEREPCDNCAYRAGSRESSDRDEWLDLQNKAKRASEYSYKDGQQCPWFCCHKGIPIRLVVDDENSSIEFDYKAAGIDPMSQTCSGFLRLLWAHNRKSKQEESRAA